MPKISKAKIDANRRWNEKNYSRIALNIKKEWTDKFKAYAEASGLSVNGLLNGIIGSLIGEPHESGIVVQINTGAAPKQPVNELHVILSGTVDVKVSHPGAWIETDVQP